MDASKLAGITAEQLATFFTNPDPNHQKMIRESEKGLTYQINEIEKDISRHRDTLHHKKLELNDAKTTLQSTKSVEESIESYKRQLEEAKKTIEICQHQIARFEKMLPLETRQKRVEALTKDISDEEKNIETLIRNKAAFKGFLEIFERAKEINRMKD